MYNTGSKNEHEKRYNIRDQYVQCHVFVQLQSLIHALWEAMQQLSCTYFLPGVINI